MQISEAVKLYEADIKRMSENTKKSYVGTIRRYLRLNEITTLDELSYDTIVSFSNLNIDNKTSGSTHNTYTAALKSFFSYLHEAGHVKEDLSKLKACKSLSDGEVKERNREQGLDLDDEDELPGKAIEKAHVRMILKTALKNTRKMKRLTSTEGERNAMMIEIDLICGMRKSDLVDLKVKNFFIDEKKTDELGVPAWRIKFWSKKSKKIVSFCVCNDSLMDRLQEYIRYNKLEANDYLFPTYKSEHMTTNAFWNMFTSLAEKAGLADENYAPHDIRRTCATWLYNKGVNLKLISLRLGHASVEMTEKYLRLKDTVEDVGVMTRALIGIF